MQEIRNFSHFPKIFSLLFTLLLLAGTVTAGCNDGDDRDANPRLRADVYVDVSAVGLAYDTLEVVFPSDGRLGSEEVVMPVEVDAEGLGLIAEKQTAGSFLKFALNFLDADGNISAVFDRTAEGVRIVPGASGRCVIPVEGLGPAPVPSPSVSPTPEPTPTATPTPDPGPSASPTPEPSPAPSASPTPEPSPAPSASPTPEPSPGPTAAPDPVDVYLKVEGDLPDMGQISVRCAGWSEKIGESAVVTLDKNGVTTEPVAVKRQVGDRLQLGVYFEQQEDWVYFDYEDRKIWIDEEYYWQPVFYYENFKGQGKGVVVPEAEGGKSVVTVKFADFTIVYDTLITYDLSAVKNDWWDDEEYQPNFILLAVHEGNEFNKGPKSMRIPLRKKGSGFAPVYLRAVTPGVQYKGYYALEYLEVDENGEVIFDSYGQATCHPIVNNGDRGSVLLPEGQTQKTIELKMSDFS